MDRAEALRRLDSATREHEGHRIRTALHYGNSVDQVADRLGLTVGDLLERYGLTADARAGREAA